MRQLSQLLEPFRSQDSGTPFLHTRPSARSGRDCWKHSAYEHAPDSRLGDQPLCTRGNHRGHQHQRTRTGRADPDSRLERGRNENCCCATHCVVEGKTEVPVIARLLSVNVGLPREITWRGQTVRTAIWKDPVHGKRTVRRLTIEGDAQADLVAHGGKHRAVFVYQIDSCRYWRDKLHRADFTFGQFGENFTVEGLPDTELCIGDQYRVGGRSSMSRSRESPAIASA
jgi:hypothetical protein